MKKRIFSMFLCLCMAFTLVGAVVPTAAAADQKPLTDEQITAKIEEEYIPAVMKLQEEHGVTKAYWTGEVDNEGKFIRWYKTDELKNFVNNGDYQSGLTVKHCYGGNHKHKTGECHSNYFKGVHTTGDWEEFQCEGFANYIEYVIFHDVDSEEAVDGSVWTKKDKDTVEDDYNFRPGDLVRYSGHSAVVYDVNDENVYFIECNYKNWSGWPDSDENDFCIIRWGRSMSQKELRTYINAGGETYVTCPPATLRADKPTPPPNAPTNVTGTWTSRGTKWQAQTSWSAVSGATGYEVEYRTLTANGWSAWREDRDYKSGTSYISTGLGNHNLHEYRVRAVNSGGTSNWVNYTLKNASETVKPPAPAKPRYITAVWTKTKPLSLTASVRVSWPAVSGAESYTVGYREKGMTLWCWGPVKSTSETFSGLNKNTSYEFCVRAVNSAGSSDLVECSLDSLTTIVSIVTYAEDKKSGPPSTIDAPTGVSGTWTSTGPKWQARISWLPVSGATLYEVQYKTPAMSEWKADGDYSSGTSYISTGLGNYNSYDYRVRAVNDTGASDWTEYTLVKSAGSDPMPEPTPGPQVPVAPANVSGTWTSTGPKWQARISWNESSGATGYEVQYRTPKTGNAWKTDADYKSGTSYISTGLGDYNSYDYRVRAVNDNGASGWTEYTLAKSIGPKPTPEPTPGPQVPAAPANVSGTWTSTGPKWQARISWNESSGATRYEVQYKTPKTNNEWRADADYSSGTSYISTGLGNYNFYDYRVRAINAAGVSEWTEYTLIKTVSVTGAAPTAPTGISGAWTSRGPKWQARISWNESSGATRYEVQYRTPRTNNEWRADADYSSGTSYISTGLGTYNSYDYRVRAVNSNGASEWTEYTLYK